MHPTCNNHFGDASTPVPAVVCSGAQAEKRLALAAGVRHCECHCAPLRRSHMHALPIALREQPVTGATIQMEA